MTPDEVRERDGWPPLDGIEVPTRKPVPDGHTPCRDCGRPEASVVADQCDRCWQAECATNPPDELRVPHLTEAEADTPVIVYGRPAGG